MDDPKSAASRYHRGARFGKYSLLSSFHTFHRLGLLLIILLLRPQSAKNKKSTLAMDIEAFLRRKDRAI
jgi:hypothetical protein